MDDLENILKDPELASDFVMNIWNFYSLERMYILRILEYILRTQSKKTVFLTFLKETGFPNIQSSLIKQLEYLSCEISCENIEHSTDLKEWVSRNYSEQLQILLLIAATIELYGIDVDGFVQLLKIFQKHNFMKHFDMLTVRNISEPLVVKNICCMEYAIFFICLKEFWHQQDNWYSHFDDIDLILKTDCYTPNYPVKMAWAVLQYTLPDDLHGVILDTYSLKEIIIEALKNKVFLDLQSILQNPVLKGTLCENGIRLGFAEFLEILCSKFAENISYEDGVLPFVIELLQSEDIAKECLAGERKALKEIFDDHITLFPSEFNCYTMLFDALINSGYDPAVILARMCSIEKFSVPYNTFCGSLYENSFLSTIYKPFDNDLIKFYVGTKVALTHANKQVYQTLYGTYSYFIVFLHLVDKTVQELSHSRHCSENASNMVINGCKLLIKIINTCYQLMLKIYNIDLLLDSITHIMVIAAEYPDQNMKLICACFDLVCVLYKYDLINISIRLINTKFFPLFSKSVYDNGYLNNNNMFTFHSVHIYTDHQLLVPFIQLVCETIKKNRYHLEIQIHGCNIIMEEWFLPIMNTEIMKNNETLDIANHLMNLIFLVLSKDRSTLPAIDLIIYDNFITLFTSKIDYLATLCKIIEYGSDKLDNLYITTPNLCHASVIQLTNVVKKSLLCLLFLLRYILLHSDIKKHTMFEEYIYNFEIEEFLQKQVSILKKVLGFIGHGMTFEIPKIVCRILTEFVKVSDKPIYPSLQLNDSLIGDMFIDRLCNPLEDENMKVCVLNFVAACVEKQHCMTAAFFDVPTKKEKSVISLNRYLTDYISSFAMDTTSLSSSVYSAILSLIHSVYKLGRCNLITDVIGLNQFWDFITWTLFETASVDKSIILDVFEIIIFELFLKNTKKSRIDYLMSQMFDESGSFLRQWMQYFINISKSDSIQPRTENVTYQLNIASTYIWKNFLLSVKRFYPEYFFRVSICPILGHECLDTIVYFSKQEETVFIKQWSEIYCFIILTSTTLDISEDNIYENLNSILRNLVAGYFAHDIFYKISIFIIFIKIFNQHNYILFSEKFTSGFLNSFGWIFVHESCLIVSEIQRSFSEESVKLWSLIITIMNMLLKDAKIVTFENFFVNQISYLNTMLEVFQVSLNKHLNIKILEVTGYSLILYAQSKFVHHFLNLDLTAFYAQCFPPERYLMCNNTFINGIIPQQLKDWWMIYIYLIRMHKILLNKLGGRVFDKIKLFIEVHEAAICESINTAIGIGDYFGTRLVANIIYLLYDVLSYANRWQTISFQSFDNILGSLIPLFNMSLIIFLRPDIISFVSDHNSDEKDNEPASSFKIVVDVPEENHVDVLNRFLHLATWICKLFIQYNPQIFHLLGSYSPPKFYRFIVNDFRVPIVLKNMKVITYSTVLCGLHYLVKILPKITKSSLEDEKSKYFTLPSKYFNVLVTPGNFNSIKNIMKPDGKELILVPIGPHTKWLYSLDHKSVFMAIEAFSTFITSHAYIIMRDLTIPRPVIRFIRRELCEELEQLYVGILQYFNRQNLHKLTYHDILNKKLPSKEEDIHGLVPINQLMSSRPFNINVDVQYFCISRPTGSVQAITNIDDAYFLILFHWLRNICKLAHFRDFDRFLSKRHHRSTCALDDSSYTKYTSIPFDDDQYDDF